MGATNGPASRKSPSHAPVAQRAELVHCCIPSDLGAGQKVQNRILAAAARRGYSPESLFAIRLALEEALINAIKHGNRLDPRKKVTIDARIQPRQVRITIEDQGPGFDRGCVPDPTSNDNLCKDHGRGILLIESYMNKVQWSRGGRRLTMIRKNP
jgi:serine/threonine-protein kinase RsbW